MIQTLSKRLFKLDAYQDEVERLRAYNFYLALAPFLLLTVLLFFLGLFRLAQEATGGAAMANENPVVVFLLGGVFVFCLYLNRIGQARIGALGFVLACLSLSLLNAGLQDKPFDLVFGGGAFMALAVSGLVLPRNLTILVTILAAANWLIAEAMVGISTEAFQPSTVAFILVGITVIIGWFAYNTARMVEELPAAGKMRETNRRLVMAETINEISKRIFTRLDLETLLSDTVEMIRARFPDVYHAQVFLIDDSRHFAELHASTGEAGKALIAKNHKLALGSTSVIGQVTGMGDYVLVGDARNDPVHRVNELLPNTQTELAIPLRSQEGIIGALDVQSTTRNAFSDEDIELLQILADQIAIAVDNVRLFGTVENEAQRSRALAEASQITSQLAVDFERGLNALFTTLAQPGSYTHWWVGLLDDGCLLRVSANTANGTDSLFPERIDLSTEHNALTETIKTQQAVVVNDLNNHPLFGGISPATRQVFGKHIATPIRSFEDGQVVGAILMGRPEYARDLDDRDMELVTSLTSQVGIALQNQRLYERVAGEQQTLESVLAATPTGIIVVDADHRVVLTNEQATRIMGVEIENGVSIDHRFPIFRTATQAPYEQAELPWCLALNDGKVHSAEDLTIKRPNGTRVDVLSQAAPILDAEGNVVSVVSIYQDITELRSLERALQDSLSETTKLYEASRSISHANDINAIAESIIDQMHSLEPSTIYITIRDDMQATENPVQLVGAWPEEKRAPLEAINLPEAILVPPKAAGTGNLTFATRNLAAIPGLTPENVEALEAQGIGALIVMPLEARGQVFGSIIGIFEEERSFAPDERRFLLTLADQAAIALDSQFLVKDLQASLQNTATLYAASRSLAESQDVTEALNITADQIFSLEPDRIDVVLARDEFEFDHLNHALEWHRTSDGAEYPALPLNSYSNFDLITSEQIFIEDINTSTNPLAQAMLAEGLPYQALASLPFRAAGQPNGRMAIGFKQPRVFTEDERQFLRLLADSAAYVIESDVLFRQTQDSLEETGILYQAIRAFANADDNDGILQAIIDYAADPAVDKALMCSLLTSRWDSPNALMEIIVSWVRVDSIDLTGMRFTPEQFPSWSQISTKEILTVDDVINDPDLDETARMGYLALDISAFVIIPLAVQSRAIGAIVLGSSQPRTHREREVRVYQSLADQAAVTMENKRLYEEAQRRARQLSTSARVAQAANSILQLEDLMPEMVDLIKDAFDYDHVQIFIISDDGRDALLKASTGEAGRQLLAIHHSLPVGSHSVIGTVTASGMPSIALDTADANVIHRPNPYLPNTRSEMAIPLIARGRILGALDVQSNLPGAFTENDVRVLEVLADQLAVAIENAQLFEISEQRTEEMRFLFNLTADATDKDTLTEILESASHMIRDQLGAAIVVPYIKTFDNLLEPGAMALNTATVLDDPQLSTLDIESDNIISSVARTMAPIIVQNVEDEPDYSPRLNSVRSGIYAPLASRDDLIGVLAVESDRYNRFDESSLGLLQALTGSLAAIIQNTNLLREVQDANVRLMEVDQLKTNFLAAMSHELRTPLNSIIGFSRVILRGIDGPITDTQKQDLQTIHDSGKHLLGLVNDILDQAKIEADKMELEKEYFDVTAVVKGVMSSAEGLTKEKPIRLITEMASDLPQGFGDEFRTRQVLLNLVSNAAKFTEQGSITTSAHLVSDNGREFIQISVTDTGIGIDERDYDKLFSSFQQVDNSTTRQAEGTGLGLPLAKSLTELQGGRIWVDSEVGAGSTFSITIPIHYYEELLPEPKNRRKQESQNGTEPAKLILAVDEDINMVNLYRRHLSNYGFDIIGVTKLDDIDKIRYSQRFYAAIVDVNFGEGAGWEVLVKLINDERQPLPTIVCSMNKDVAETEKLGALGHIVRPFQSTELIQTVRQIEQRVP